MSDPQELADELMSYGYVRTAVRRDGNVVGITPQIFNVAIRGGMDQYGYRDQW